MPIFFWRNGKRFRNTRISIGQTTKYAAGDSGDYRIGTTPSYSVLSTGNYSGTKNLDVAHYAAATIAFVSATKKITDSANGLVEVLTGDTIVIYGSTLNDGVYTVATGGVAGEIVTTEALVNESAGAVITILKRAAHSNNAVADLLTGLMWARYTSAGEKLGVASDGKLTWYAPLTDCTLHAAAGDLAISSTTKKLTIVGGAAELPIYKVGTHIVLSGFAQAANNLAGGFRVDTVAVNGSDLDITLWPGYRNTFVTETAAGSRAIKLVTENIFSYAAAANAISLGGYTDWRNPDDIDLLQLRNMETDTAAPDSTAFPSWPTNAVLCSVTVYPPAAGYEETVDFSNGYVGAVANTTACYTALVRG